MTAKSSRFPIMRSRKVFEILVGEAVPLYLDRQAAARLSEAR